MKQEKIIYLSSESEDKITINKVIYDTKVLMETVNEISLKLGAKKEIRNQKTSVFESEYDRVYTKSSPYTYDIVHSYSLNYSSLQRMMPGEYEFYFNEDQIIKYLLSFQLDTKIIDSFYNNRYEVVRERFKFHNDFCFLKLYQYLEEKNLLSDNRYLELLRDYLKIFQIIETKNTINEEDFQKKYYNATRKDWVSRDAYRIQQNIAQANSKILALKK